MNTFNNIIIGFGKGGKTLAVALAKKGESVALIEQNPEMYGGTCINIGCIPSKKLLTLSQEKHPTTLQEKAEYYEQAIDETTK
ncbi:MAG: FAD-dependent oxidoreductase, partial [candidate division SR1 bacterium]|nr:FAD-dependent oxidoreductase [candidate division SR1 bacterium]